MAVVVLRICVGVMMGVTSAAAIAGRVDVDVAGIAFFDTMLFWS